MINKSSNNEFSKILTINNMYMDSVSSYGYVYFFSLIHCPRIIKQLNWFNITPLEFYYTLRLQYNDYFIIFVKITYLCTRIILVLSWSALIIAGLFGVSMSIQYFIKNIIPLKAKKKLVSSGQFMYSDQFDFISSTWRLNLKREGTV
jgi:hypothetical protein